MEFFELFFSGPGWGWRLFCLIILISVVGEIPIQIVKAFCKAHYNIKREEIMKEVADAMKEDVHDASATKDDFR